MSGSFEKTLVNKASFDKFFPISATYWERFDFYGENFS